MVLAAAPAAAAWRSRLPAAKAVAAAVESGSFQSVSSQSAPPRLASSLLETRRSWWERCCWARDSGFCSADGEGLIADLHQHAGYVVVLGRRAHEGIYFAEHAPQQLVRTRGRACTQY